jgi:hypothetical protein
VREVTTGSNATQTSRTDASRDGHSYLRPWLFKIAFIGGVCVVIGGSLLPGRDMPALINDKVEHFLAYGALATVGSLTCRTRQDRLMLVLFLFVLAVGLEIAQRFSPGRSTEFFDALAGWMGACLAFVPLRRPRSAFSDDF